MTHQASCSALVAGLLCASLPLAASAAVFSYEGVVFRTPGAAATPADPDFPPLRTVAQVELFIDDSDPNLVLDESMPGNVPAGFASASVDIPGYLSGSMAYDPGEGFSLGTDFHFAAYGPSILDNPGSFTFLDQGLHSITIFFSNIPGTPTTVGELVAAISQPGTRGIFAFEAEGDDAPQQFYRVDSVFPATPSGVIPLPASFLMFGTALAGLAAFRRRKGAN